MKEKKPGLIQKLREKLFGVPASSIDGHQPSSFKDNSDEKSLDTFPGIGSQRRDPYFVQIGLDFGTAYSKCVYRDVITDKARVYSPDSGEGSELSFLMPSLVGFNGTAFASYSGQMTSDYTPLPFIKTALERAAIDEINDPILDPFRNVNGVIEVRDFVECAAVYLLARMLGGVRAEIRRRFSESVEGDYLAVNMAVPVSSVDQSEVRKVFQRVLCLSWVLADEIGARTSLDLSELLSLINSNRAAADEDEVVEACFIYPEVSANVQGFVRSRVSSPGLYLFSDTGAGTVDQSVFIFGRNGGVEQLSYLHAEVFPLGSSNIERIVMELEGLSGWDHLERWRKRKESGHDCPSLRRAKNRIADELDPKSKRTIALAKQKLFRKQQLSDLKIIFGGGGHSDYPYAQPVLNQFNSDLFRSEDIVARKRDGDPFELGMPMPKDLTGSKEIDKTDVSRLSVAYGLSFERGQLADFALPNDVAKPNQSEIWKPIRKPVFDYDC